MKFSAYDRDHDIVCGISITRASHRIEVIYKRKKYIVCSPVCAKRFRMHPAKFFCTPLIQLTDVWKIFKTGTVETRVLQNVDIRIWPGDFVALVGASGSGKSTALNMIGLLDRPTSGQVFIQGKDASTFSEQERALLRSETFGFIFQQYNLIPWLTAYENVVLPRIFADLPIKKESMEAEFDRVGLLQQMHQRPTVLSGGEQQRTALIRALATNPPIILGDEPTGNLDSITGKKILERLVDLHHREGRTLIVVSHDKEIAKLADYVVTLKDGSRI